MKNKWIWIALTGGLILLIPLFKKRKEIMKALPFGDKNIKQILQKIDNIYKLIPPRRGRIRTYEDLERETYNQLSAVYPKFAGIVKKVIDEMNSYLKRTGSIYRVGVFEGLRSSYRQYELLKKGTTKALPGQSYHQLGLAVDIVFWSPQTGWTWEVPSELWNKLGEIGKKYGLEWGGDWGWDRPHFQMRLSSLPDNVRSDVMTKREMIVKAFVAAAQKDGYTCYQEGGRWRCRIA